MISVLRIRCPFLSRHKDNNCRVTHSANLSWQQHRMSVLLKYSLQFCYCLKWKILFFQQIIVTRNTCADYFIFIQQFIEWHVHKSGVVCICFSVAAEVADFCSENFSASATIRPVLPIPMIPIFRLVSSVLSLRQRMPPIRVIIVPVRLLHTLELLRRHNLLLRAR